MNGQFYDSSAFAKLFIQEKGTAEMLELYRAAHTHIVSRLAFVEVHAAIRRREREGDLSKIDAERAAGLLQGEAQRIKVIDLTNQNVTAAQLLVNTYPLRSLDAIQLACAKITGCKIFVSTDVRLCRFADQEGLAVVNLTRV